MGQAVSGLNRIDLSQRGHYGDSSVHSCRSVHPEEGADEDNPGNFDGVVVDAAELDNPGAGVELAADSLKRTEERQAVQLSSEELKQHCQQLDEGDRCPENSGGAKRPSEREDSEKRHNGDQQNAGCCTALGTYLAGFFRRMKGGHDKSPKVPPLLDVALGWIGAFSSILAIAALGQWATPDSHFNFLVASFGASAVLVFGAADGKLSQPRSLLGGHVFSAIVGCVVRLIFRPVIWLSTAIGMATALSVMQCTGTLHPPGGATALIAASAPNPLPRGAGFSIVLVVLIDACIMLVIGLLVNNVREGKGYPTYWL